MKALRVVPACRRELSKNPGFHSHIVLLGVVASILSEATCELADKHTLQTAAYHMPAAVATHASRGH